MATVLATLLIHSITFVSYSFAGVCYTWVPVTEKWKADPAGGEVRLPSPIAIPPEEFFLARVKLIREGKEEWDVGKWHRNNEHFTSLLATGFIWSTSDKTIVEVLNHEHNVVSWIDKERAQAMIYYPNFGGKLEGCEEYSRICRTMRLKRFTYGPATGQEWEGVVPGYVYEDKCNFEWKGVRFIEEEYEVLKINEVGSYCEKYECNKRN